MRKRTEAERESDSRALTYYSRCRRLRARSITAAPVRRPETPSSTVMPDSAPHLRHRPRRRALAGRIADPRSRQRRHGRSRHPAVLVRRARRDHAGVHPRSRRGIARARRDVLFAELRHSGAARRDRALRFAIARRDRRRPDRRHCVRHVGADARRRSAGRTGRPRGRRDTDVAEPGRDPEDSRRERRLRAARLPRRTVDARRRSPARGADAGHAARADQLAEQSDRLDDRPGCAGGDPRALPAAGHLDRRRRRLRAARVRRRRTARRRSSRSPTPTIASSARTASPSHGA